MFQAVLACDPGPKFSAYALISDDDLSVIQCKKVDNEELIDDIKKYHIQYDDIVIEECVCHRHAGREVSDTAFVAGRIYEAGLNNNVEATLKTRSWVRGHWGARNDSKIIDSLMCRFEPLAFLDYLVGNISRGKMLNISKETWFEGFSADIWQAYALGVAYIDKQKGEV